MFDLDPGKWDCLNPSELTLVEGNSVTPYMPYFWQIDVRQTGRTEPLENGECRFFFELDRHVPDLWQLFFENHRNGDKVSFERNILTLVCHPKDLARIRDRICYEAIPLATNEYRQERDTLLWQVFLRMKEQQRLERTEAEIVAELDAYKQKRQQRVDYAEQHGFSVSFFVQNFNDRYREILENKFKWWGKVLDGMVITKYRAIFELEFLPV